MLVLTAPIKLNRAQLCLQEDLSAAAVCAGGVGTSEPLLIEKVLLALSFEKSVAHQAAFLLVFKPLRAEPAS